MNFLDWLSSGEGPAQQPGPGEVVMFFVPRRDFDALAAAAKRTGLSPQQALSKAVELFLASEPPRKT